MIQIHAMDINIFNTFTGRKEPFKTIHDNSVGLYVCGVTVYDHCHIGHARSAIVFDVIVRYLLEKGYKVTSVKNFTDIDDKIIKRSVEEGISWKEVSEKYIASFYEDMDSLNILRPTYEPRATEHIDEMIGLVETLLKNGNAYIMDGDVYFSVESFKGYGELSKRSLDEMLAGARVDINEKKKNPLDFALWKSSKEGEPWWDAPFGRGRPGWHIECSVMSTKYLGNPFDIHGGGKDLIFPHHENERAQTEAATGKKFVNYWIHNGFVNIEKEKMSKSLGNILLIKNFIREYHPEALRLFFLSNHYRSPVDYNEKSIDDSNSALYRLYHTIERADELERQKKTEQMVFSEADDVKQRFYEAMDDDFNTALALSCIFELSRILNRLIDIQDEGNLPFIAYTKSTILHLCHILGILNDEWHIYDEHEKTRHLTRTNLSLSDLNRAIEERAEARKNRDFKRADSIREMLLSKGILLQDTPRGTEWRIKK
ncbi:MAG TPA: cysteine--tRNA ligase [Syntrophorhabdaceae bacterium]|mgnify:FL=1|nr:cysteine--tRNA ligase [Syntrophorhabdaceae bacterium]HPP42252.1 cysteine--tRNA ligase [Syntrophorhabdaceae bacterium]